MYVPPLDPLLYGSENSSLSLETGRSASGRSREKVEISDGDVSFYLYGVDVRKSKIYDRCSHVQVQLLIN